MTKESRHEYILDALARTNYIKVSELLQNMDVSIVTVRNDLKELERKGLLKRTRGGAMFQDDTFAEYQSLNTLPFSPKDIPNLALKEALAIEAIRHINPDDSIYLGSGATFFVISKLLRHFKDLRIVTANLSIAYELAPYNKNIYFVGGELSESGSVYQTGGSKTPQELDNIFVNKSLIGVSGINYDGMLTLHDLAQYYAESYAKKMASKVFLVVESTKIGRQSAHKLGLASEIADVIITNRTTDERACATLKNMGIPVILT